GVLGRVVRVGNRLDALRGLRDHAESDGREVVLLQIGAHETPRAAIALFAILRSSSANASDCAGNSVTATCICLASPHDSMDSAARSSTPKPVEPRKTRPFTVHWII